MGASQRRKGATFERKIANELREALGLAREDVRRGVGQSRGGGAEVPDVELPAGLPVHLECKHSNSVSPAAALRQAHRDAALRGGNLLPVAIIKRDREPIRVFAVPQVAHNLCEGLVEGRILPLVGSPAELPISKATLFEMSWPGFVVALQGGLKAHRVWVGSELRLLFTGGTIPLIITHDMIAAP